jgi:PAS domain S-box-containing protein
MHVVSDFSRELLIEGVMQAPLGIAICKLPDYTVETANSYYLEMMDRDQEGLLQKPLFSTFPESRQVVEPLFRKVLETQIPYYGNEVPRVLHRRGKVDTAYFNFVYQPLKASDGTLSGIMIVAHEVTREVEAKYKLQESEQKFRLLADSMPQFIWTGDPEGNLNYFNRSVFEYSGLTFEQMKGHGWIKIIHPADRVANVEKWKASIQNGVSFHFEHRFRRRDGQYRWQLSRALPQKDVYGKIQMWVGTSTDIHDQKTVTKRLEAQILERTKELNQINEQLKKTNQELEQFAYIASHDLQEPLRKIQTFSNILQNNIHDNTYVEKYFSKIDSSARRMGDLIKAVLNYSRLADAPTEFEETDLNLVLESVLSDLELLIEEKNGIIQSDRLPVVSGIPLQLNQLFSNLIGNSLKFCQHRCKIRISHRHVSGTEISRRFQATGEKPGFHELTFQDNGIGFESRFATQIFTIFQRLHSMHEYSGTGIGLALCKKIVENHGGFISAQSESGEGATFTVYLPA